MSNKFKVIREHIGLTQKQFSELLGIKQSYYSSIERGDKKPSANVVSQLIDLGVPANWYYSNDTNDTFPILNLSSKLVDVYKSRQQNANSVIKIGENAIIGKSTASVTTKIKDEMADNASEDDCDPFYWYFFKQYKNRTKSDFDANSFKEISSILGSLSKSFEYLQADLLGDIHNIHTKMINKALKNKDFSYQITDNDYEVMKKYEIIFEQYKQYENAITQIAGITMMATPYMKQVMANIKKQILEDLTEKDKYFDS